MLKSKKLVSMFLITVMILSISPINIFASNDKVVSGMVIPKEQVENVFESGNLPPQAYSGNNAQTMYINQVNIQNETISITGNVFLNNQANQFHLIGDLFNSNLQKRGFSAYCAKLIDQNDNYNVLYCFIKNDTLPYDYVLNQELSNSKLLQLYLKDANGNVIAIEDDLDNISINTENLQSTKVADSEDDELWFGKILPGTYTEYEPITSYSLQDGISYTTTLSRSSTYYGQQWVEYANAKVWGQIGDVPKYGNASAQSALKLEESTYIDGTYYDSISNFSLQEGSNTDLKGIIALGYNTVGLSSQWTGKYWKGSSFNGSVSLGLGWGIGHINASYDISIPLNTAYYYSDDTLQITGNAKNVGIVIP